MTVHQRKKAHEFDQRILEIFDGYVHGKITKRQFISQAGKYAAAGVTGAMLLEQFAAELCIGPAGGARRSGHRDDGGRLSKPRGPWRDHRADGENPLVRPGRFRRCWWFTRTGV